MKNIICLALIITATQAHAEYVWKSLICGNRFVQLVDTNSTDATYSGIIVNDEYYNEETTLSHKVENGETNTIFTAKNYKLKKWVGLGHYNVNGVNAYIEYNINDQGEIIGESTYGAKCH